MQAELRPIERRVLSLLDSGVDVSEVARRFHRSAPHITQVARLARLDGRHHVPVPSTLRPIERRISRSHRRPLQAERSVDRASRGSRQLQAHAMTFDL